MVIWLDTLQIVTITDLTNVDQALITAGDFSAKHSD